MTEPSPIRPAVVLVADRTLSGRYKALFEGIFATMQTTQAPEFAMRHLLSPAIKTDAAGRARFAPLGLRRIEAALLSAGLSAQEVVVTTPEALPRLLGPWTKVVAFSSSDPLGNGMSNTTTRSFWKGRLYTAKWTEELLSVISAAKRRWPFKVIAGGAGAWQWAQDPEECRRQGVDIVFEGYFESAGPAMIADLLAGKDVPPHVVEKGVAIESLRPIVAPSVMGVIELSRGCGNGCRFCTMSTRPMAHLSPDTILADVQTNVAGGATAIVSSSEDFFRYGGTGWKVHFEALAGLLEQMRRIDGLSFMQIDHANITSILQLSDDQLRQIRKLLTWPSRTDYLWVNMGLESANGHLVKATGGGKLGDYRPEDWEDMVRQAAAKTLDNGFFPVFSLVLGLPGETPDDVARTLALVKELDRRPVTIFPVFHEPWQQQARREGQAFTVEKMRADHLELYTTCYEINFRWVPRLYWDNQRAGGVSWLKRALLRGLGKTEVRAWRGNFARIRRRLEAG